MVELLAAGTEVGATKGAVLLSLFALMLSCFINFSGFLLISFAKLEFEESATGLELLMS